MNHSADKFEKTSEAIRKIEATQERLATFKEELADFREMLKQAIAAMPDE